MSVPVDVCALAFWGGTAPHLEWRTGCPPVAACPLQSIVHHLGYQTSVRRPSLGPVRGTSTVHKSQKSLGITPFWDPGAKMGRNMTNAWTPKVSTFGNYPPSPMTLTSWLNQFDFNEYRMLP